MASSSNPKSNSSGSRQKPTYRKAGKRAGASRSGAAAARPAEPAAAEPARPKPASYAVPSQRKRPGTVSAAPRQAAAPRPATPASRTVPPAARPAAAQKKTGRASKAADQPAAGSAASAPQKAASAAATPKKAAAPAAKPARRAAARPERAARAAGPRSLTSVPGRQRPASSARRGKRGEEGGSGAASLVSRVPVPRAAGLHVSPVLLGVLGVIAALLVAGVLVINSGLFLVQTVVVNGGEHVSQEMAEQLVEVADGTTMFTIDESAILASLQKSPWVADVEIERTWPSTITITPVERTVALLTYSSTDDIAWLVSADATWITPVSLAVATDEDGELVEQLEDGSWPEGATELSGSEAALAVAGTYGALLVIDVPSSVSPESGAAVESEEILAALMYYSEFSSDFLATIKSLSVSSVEAISANLTSGVEVALGAAEDIATKEKVITKLLEEQEGVTYINVREADAYTFRSTPTS